MHNVYVCTYHVCVTETESLLHRRVINNGMYACMFFLYTLGPVPEALEKIYHDAAGKLPGRENTISKSSDFVHETSPAPSMDLSLSLSHASTGFVRNEKRAWEGAGGMKSLQQSDPPSAVMARSLSCACSLARSRLAISRALALSPAVALSLFPSLLPSLTRTHFFSLSPILSLSFFFSLCLLLSL